MDLHDSGGILCLAAAATRRNSPAWAAGVKQAYRMTTVVVLVWTSLWIPSRVLGAGKDWPMWRFDAGRSAASPLELPPQLHLQWKHELPAPRPAFPNDPRLCFDVSYEPVAAGKRVFVPSMV